MTEKELTAAVIEMAQRFGWLVHHDRPARFRDGSYATHILGDKGFPDLVLARGETVWFVELKVGRNKPTETQERWLDTLPFSDVWTEKDWPDGIERVLR